MAADDLERRLIANAYRSSIIENVKHDEASIRVNTREGAEAYQNEVKALDEEEAMLKGQYVSEGCEEQTGMSVDAFRHQTISDYTHEQMAAQEQDAQNAQSYWGENQGVTAKGNSQEASDQYWNSQCSTENGNTVVEDGNQASASSENTASSDMSASADNSVSNENSI